jgi:mannonate dehydratase
MGVDVFETIREIGSMGKIAYVHFRNVRGTPHRFQEVFVDEGQVDMFRAMQTYKAVGFNGPFMMDHTPGIPGDADGREGHAYATGYMRAMIQAVYR